MSVSNHRKQLLDTIADDSIVICYSGQLVHTNEDDYYYPFEVNSQFFWLTGIERANMVLLLTKIGGKTSETLFIEEADPSQERWTGKMLTPEEATDISGIENVSFVADFSDTVDFVITRNYIRQVYFDVFRQSQTDAPDFNLIKAKEFADKFPAITLCDLHAVICPLRRVKDAEEIADVRAAIDVTRQGLERVMSKLKPGMMEYQVQAEFEYVCRSLGTKKYAFPTIAGSGYNGCMLHYETNEDEVPADGLILLDLGAKYNNYCSDITRTYPVNGTYSPRQRQYYELVLKANREVAKAARPGITLRDLQELCRRVLGEGLVEMGKIDSVDDVSQYYMHGVSHSIGIDAHDVNIGQAVLEPGWIISDEPGLYIDEEEIGIRIEDDLLITEDGCEVLSENIIRDPDEIEAFMKNSRG